MSQSRRRSVDKQSSRLFDGGLPAVLVDGREVVLVKRTMPHLGADLDWPLAQCGQRPSLDDLGRRQRASEVRQVVGKSVQLEPNRVWRKPHAIRWRPS